MQKYLDLLHIQGDMEFELDDGIYMPNEGVHQEHDPVDDGHGDTVGPQHPNDLSYMQAAKDFELYHYQTLATNMDVW